MLPSQREHFDIPADITYLNAAYMGPLSHEVVAAGEAGLRRKMRPWIVQADDFFDDVDAVRTLFGQVVGGDADGVAIIPAVSYGVAVAAQNLTPASGQRIVILAEQFPSNVYAWFDLAERTGAEVATVPRPVDGDWTRAVLDAIDERCAAVAVETCHWTDGSIVDIGAVGAAARRAGATLVIDATQSLGAMPFDVEVVQPDFLIAATYKWLLAPYGTAAMWVAPAHREGRPLERSWITRSGASNFAGLVEYNDTFREGARRYDVGQTSDFSKMAGFKAALEQNLSWGGASAVGAYAAALNTIVADGGRSLGLGVAAEHLRAPHMFGLELGDADPQAVAAAMAEARVFVSVRGRAMRVSPHVYNTAEEATRLVDALGAAL